MQQEPKTYDLAGVTEMQEELKGLPCETCLNYRTSEPGLQGFCVKYSAHQWPTWRLFDCWSHSGSKSLQGKLIELGAALATLASVIQRMAK